MAATAPLPVSETASPEVGGPVWWTMQKVWMAWKNLVTMLARRGWAVPPHDGAPEREPSWEAFWSWVVSQWGADSLPRQGLKNVFDALGLVFTTPLVLPGKPKPVQTRVIVHWCPYEKVGTDVMSTYISRMEQCGASVEGRGGGGAKSLWILITRSSLTPPARSILDCVRKGGMNHGGTEVVACEVFLLDDLLIDPTESALVPTHKLCSPAEQAAVFSAYHLTVRDCPAIRATDPIARYYGALRGQLFRIERADGDITYRVVA